MTTKTIHGFVSGKVQGVWFRDFVRGNARSYELCGYARNLPDTRVEFLLHGDEAAVLAVLELIRRGPELARVDHVQYEELTLDPPCEDFTIG